MTSLEHEDASRGNESVSDYDYDNWGDNENWGDMEVGQYSSCQIIPNAKCTFGFRLEVKWRAVVAVVVVVVPATPYHHHRVPPLIRSQMVGIMKNGAAWRKSQ